MAEVPDRKVLKDVLALLKAKSLASEEYYNRVYQLVLDHALTTMNDMVKKFNDSNQPLDATYVATAVSIMIGFFQQVHGWSIDLVDDLKLYIESLETRSSELDNAFWSGIEEQAKRLVEEKRKGQEEDIKQQEELLKRKPKTPIV
jgi:low affinity Fe/Cu permease